jgi:NAD(P)-dependent dehydrogenase (short-subunit alcohol dehydrogenase family)
MVNRVSAAGARVAVVTGASRGAGRGIAIALGSHGFTVFVTGRTESADQSPLGGTIHETAKAVDAAGGAGIAVRVDHRNDDEISALFDRVQHEAGRLDILVNNAALIHDDLQRPAPFWEKTLEASVDLLDVGLRSGLVAAYHAAPLLTARRGGLLVFTSASGAMHYVYGPAYGAHKAGMDKFAADMAVDLEPFGAAALSIWMGALRTERMQNVIDSDPEQFQAFAESLETPELTGHVIAALFEDPELMTLSGQTLIGAELARRYGIKDAGDRQPPSFRDIFNIAPANYVGRIAGEF